MYTIDKSVPIPAKKSHGKPKDELSNSIVGMEVGDSIFVEKMTSGTLGARAFRFAKTMKRKFTVRTEGSGARIWRLK